MIPRPRHHHLIPATPVLIKMSVTAAKLLDGMHRQRVRDFVNHPLSPPDSDDECIDVVSLMSLSASSAYWSNHPTAALSNFDPKSISLPLSICLPQTGKAYCNQTQPIRSKRRCLTQQTRLSLIIGWIKRSFATIPRQSPTIHLLCALPQRPGHLFACLSAMETQPSHQPRSVNLIIRISPPF